MKKNYYEGIKNKLNYYIQTKVFTEKMNRDLQMFLLLLEDNTLTPLEQESIILEINKYEKEIESYLTKVIIQYESFMKSTNILPEDKGLLEKYIRYLNNEDIYFDQKLVFLQMADDLKKGIQKKNEQFHFVRRCVFFIANEDIDKDTKIKLEENMAALLNKKLDNEVKDAIMRQSEEIIEVIQWEKTAKRLREYMKIENLSEHDLVESEYCATLLETDLIDNIAKREVMVQAMEKIAYYKKVFSEYTESNLGVKKK